MRAHPWSGEAHGSRLMVQVARKRDFPDRRHGYIAQPPSARRSRQPRGEPRRLGGSCWRSNGLGTL